MEFEVVAEGLQFPEGPIALLDGSVLVVEIRSGHLTRIGEDRHIERIAYLGGGPNGAAIGPDKAVYVANNGGFSWQDFPDGTMAPLGIPDNYSGGSIQRVDLETGSISTIYTACEGKRLRGPNDIVFDASGGFYFTDLGKWTDDNSDWGSLFYARPDGSRIVRLRNGLLTPNGIGLSPDGRILYVAESLSARLWAFDILEPGVIAPALDHWAPGRLVWNASEYQVFDSLAVESNGAVCVASVARGGIEVISPDSRSSTHIPLPAKMITNLCFGGEGMRTVHVTAGDTGKLLKSSWPRSGLRLEFAA